MLSVCCLHRYDKDLAVEVARQSNNSMEMALDMLGDQNNLDALKVDPIMAFISNSVKHELPKKTVNSQWVVFRCLLAE